ncbi:ATP-binding cassette domain-containing protein [Thermogutta sp.]|uniref:ATP-binding cassette domain-containing protein n=1 Tax=Thermogutta sp. TaxID=1962930 RepID=UPI00321FC89F
MQSEDLGHHLFIYEKAVEQLVKTVPRVRDLVVGRLQHHWDGTGFDAMKNRFESFRQLRGRGLQPPLVVTLFGPSGAGKSTLFRWLTGIDVPAGEILRPTTYQSVVAVPESFANPAVVALVFPEQKVVPLENPQEVAQKPRRETRVFYAPLKTQANSLPFIVADVPDFNTVECANWKQAEQMLSRAELTIFLTYPESYADYRTVEMLARCCWLSSRLVYILTKTSHQAAAVIWRDLLEKTANQKDFRKLRQDGRTLYEFLRESLCYYSPRVNEGEDPSVEPLDSQQPSFLDLIRGQPARELILAGLVQSVSVALPACKKFLQCGYEYIDQITKDLSTANTQLQELVKKVVSESYPLSGLMKFIAQVAREKTSGLLRRTLSSMNRAVGKLVTPQTVKDRTQATATFLNERGKPLAELEKEKFQLELTKYLEGIRERYPQGSREDAFRTATFLSAEQSYDLIKQVLDQPWPEPSSGWQDTVREDVQKFLEENPSFRRWMAILDDTVWTVGAGLFVLDLSLTGGWLSTTIGPITLAGVGGSVAMNTIRRTLLGSLAEKVHQAWVAQRSGELQRFLEKHFFEVLFESRLADVRSVSLTEIEESLQACDVLEQLVCTMRGGG